MPLAVLIVEVINESADVAVVVSLMYVVIESFVVIPFNHWSYKFIR